MATLGVNIDHVATLRQARGTKYPDPSGAALAAEKGGADQITIHLREDRRHIQDHDLTILRKVVQTELNLEMALTDEMVKIAIEIKPNTVTLVPEKREELTTEGGLDVLYHSEKIEEAIQELKDAGIRTSLFIDPEADQIKKGKDLGADAIEVHSGAYAEAGFAFDKSTEADQYRRIGEAVKLGKSLGLMVAVGHGLNYMNTKPLTEFKEIQEYNIGHSIVARAVFVGLEQAVREMKEIVS